MADKLAKLGLRLQHSSVERWRSGSPPNGVGSLIQSDVLGTLKPTYVSCLVARSFGVVPLQQINIYIIFHIIIPQQSHSQLHEALLIPLLHPRFMVTSLLNEFISAHLNLNHGLQGDCQSNKLADGNNKVG